MNTKSRKLLIAAGLVLGLSAALGTVQAASLSHTGRSRAAMSTIDLGTITVTPADMYPASSNVAYLGRIQVTPADAEDTRTAKAATVFLGTVKVTEADAEDVRVAARTSAPVQTVFLGTVRVTAADAEALSPAVAQASLRGAVTDALAALQPGKLVNAGHVLRLIGRVSAGL